ncbi:beta-N-acetylhexosaminidase [Tissierella sp. Yu-01]|uniref:beta-N-acetylhexosaminidase n=1 Tax=Tissierella sp. Yu-01 TaxID=3035694 RepID=UPI00240D149D|nr:beta-N-acetylhexosaminidase [Tissierella sp. Yu-01]WFA09408.1 beta-N-acetylhexosaminidase [Tissierella sp. Yu-01]
MKKKIFLIINLSICICILLIGCSKAVEPPDIQIPDIEVPDDPPVVEPEEDPIDEQIKEMTLEEKVGQLLIVGVEGKEISETDISHIQNMNIGGFVFFSRNIENEEQLLDLLNSLKEENKINNIPLFLSVDEEGGIVSRLSKIFTNLPNASILGEKDDLKLSFEYGENLGTKLKSLGFNIDFAPVLDINSNPDNPVIGNRALGKTADSVTRHGMEVMNGIKSQNIIPVAKHFPGHGDTSVDSHLALPRVDKSLEDLENLELIPFENAIKNNIEMIMVAHILYPQIDENFPSSISEILIKDILRDKLKFNGVVISDDITMGAIVDNYSIEEASLQFLVSGGDIVLVCHGNENPTLVFNRIIAGVKNGELSESELDDKIYRILKLKKFYNLEDKTIERIETDDVNSKTIELINKFN